MSKDDIYERVMAMDENELDRMVAELAGGFTRGRMSGLWYRDEPGWLQGRWWSPSRRIEDAWPLWTKLQKPRVVTLYACDDGWHLFVMTSHDKVIDFGILGPANITRTWVYVKLCERSEQEGA